MRIHKGFNNEVRSIEVNGEKPKWSCEKDSARKLQDTVANGRLKMWPNCSIAERKVTSQNIVHAEVKIGEGLLPFGSESLVSRFAVSRHTETEISRYVVCLTTDP